MTLNIIDLLNSAFKADPNAMHALMVNRVPCNMALADHPDIIVEKVLASDEDLFQVGLLGIINGIMHVNNLPLVAIKFTDEKDKDGRYRILGFCNYVEAQTNDNT